MKTCMVLDRVYQLGHEKINVNLCAAFISSILTMRYKNLSFVLKIFENRAENSRQNPI